MVCRIPKSPLTKRVLVSLEEEDESGDIQLGYGK